MFDKKMIEANIQPFEKKVWLSSPTMHGEEIKYVTEAYETNWMSTVGANINEEALNLLYTKEEFAKLLSDHG